MNFSSRSRDFFSLNDCISFILLFESCSTQLLLFLLQTQRLSAAKITYILLICLLAITSCKPTKLVPEGRYLLKKNDLKIKGDKLDQDEVESIFRQNPNYKRLGVKWKLMAFNAIDSGKVADKRAERNIHIRDVNRDRLSRQDKVNGRRMERARTKGTPYYREKRVNLKDTIDPSMFLREWIKYKVGRPPVIFDSIPFRKTLSQLSAYMESKGYYYSQVNGLVDYSDKDKATVTYLIETGEQYKINSLTLKTTNEDIKNSYNKFLSTREDVPLEGESFDSDELDELRYELTRFMKNESYYGFVPSSITYVADTSKSTMKVDLVINIGDRAIPSKEDSEQIIYKPYAKTKIKEVYFHVADTALYDGDFMKELEKHGLNLYENQFVNTLDTIYFQDVRDKKTKQLDFARFAYMTFNGKLFVKAKVLESFNYLEKDGYYSEAGVERSYRNLLRTGIFSMIKTNLREIEDGVLEVHYYLVPSKRQSFSAEPRATNANGYLGVSANFNYVNRNLFRGAEKLTIAVSGGFESQPPVFSDNEDGSQTQISGRTLNIFEIGPSVKLELPKLFPFDVREISKRNRPSTLISAAYFYQYRPDFERGSFQMNYLWKFASSKTHLFHAGFPLLSVVKIININKDSTFENKLTQLNDLFLLNAYSNQLVYQDWKFTYDYSNKDSEKRKGNGLVYFVSTFDPAGNFLSLIIKDKNGPNVQDSIGGIPFSQFVRLDNELILSKPFGKERSFHFRFLAGGGYPYGNTVTSLPYDYSFYAGGANDNRGWAARSLGPGAYNYLLDTNRTSTQLGDLRLGSSVELRFAMSSFFKGAIFADVGNIWTVNDDINREGAQFSDTWFKELSLATGFGLRLDLEYFIFRLDVGIPLTNPALPPGERWIFDKDRSKFNEQATLALGTQWDDYVPRLFPVRFHFGLGYPF